MRPDVCSQRFEPRRILTCNGCAWRVLDALYDGSSSVMGANYVCLVALEGLSTQGSMVAAHNGFQLSQSDTCVLQNPYRPEMFVPFGMANFSARPPISECCASHMHAQVLTHRVKGKSCDQVAPALCDSSQREMVRLWNTPKNGRTLNIQSAKRDAAIAVKKGWYTGCWQSQRAVGHIYFWVGAGCDEMIK